MAKRPDLHPDAERHGQMVRAETAARTTEYLSAATMALPVLCAYIICVGTLVHWIAGWAW